MNREFFEALKLLSKEKRIQMDALCEGIQKAIVTAVKRDFNNKDIVFCEIDPDKQEMKVYVRKNVVSEISDPDCDLLPEQAQPYKNGAVPGDIVEIPLETKDVSRIAADKGKHVLRQGIREAEHGLLREEFQSKNQEIITAKGDGGRIPCDGVCVRHAGIHRNVPRAGAPDGPPGPQPCLRPVLERRQRER